MTRHTFGPDLEVPPVTRKGGPWSPAEVKAARSRPAIRWTCCGRPLVRVILGEHEDGEPAACLDGDSSLRPELYAGVETKRYARPEDGEPADTLRMVCQVCGSDTRLSADRALQLLRSAAAAEGAGTLTLDVRLVAETRRG